MIMVRQVLSFIAEICYTYGTITHTTRRRQRRPTAALAVTLSPKD
jgi:hypothetical protein